MAPGIADPAAGPAPSTADPEVPRDVSSGITVPGSGRRLVVVVIYTSPLDTDFPTVYDGARGVHFIHKAVESGKSDAKWVDVRYTPPGA